MPAHVPFVVAQRAAQASVQAGAKGAQATAKAGKAATKAGKAATKAGKAAASTTRKGAQGARGLAGGARRAGQATNGVRRPAGRAAGRAGVRPGQGARQGQSNLGKRFRQAQDRLGGERGGRDRDRGAQPRPLAYPRTADPSGEEARQGAGGAVSAGAGAMLAADPGRTAARAAAGAVHTARRVHRTVRRIRRGVRMFTRWIPGHKARRRVLRLAVLLVTLVTLLTFAIALSITEEDEQEQARQTAQLLQMVAMCEGGAAGGAGDGTTSILGSSQLDAAQLQAWWGSTRRGQPGNLGAPIDQVIGFYIDEGNATGVRGDVALAQAIHETGWFGNADTLNNNYAGIGNTDGTGGHRFPTPRQGVRAHLDLLKSYTTGSGPGQAQTWGEVGNDWSGTDTGAGYWAQVRAVYHEMLRHAGVEDRSTGPAAGSGSGIGQGPRRANDPRSGGSGSGGGTTAGRPTGTGAGITQGSRSGSSLPAGMDLERALAAIRKIESGSYQGNYRADNGWGATGAYGFLDGTWGRYQGYARAKDAPPAVQDARAREHVHEILDQLDGPWERELALGWYLGAGPTGARPFMDMPDSDPRWNQPRDAFGTTPRGYLQRFREDYAGATAGAGGAGAAGLCGPGAGDAGAEVPSSRERVVDPNNTSRMQRVIDAVIAQFGRGVAVGCFRSGADAQDHGEGRACDYMLSSGGRMPTPAWEQRGHQLAQWLIDNASRLGVRYIIWQQKIWHVNDPHWRGMEDRGSLTQNHFDHVHISVQP